VPANVAFQFSILDANGRRISPIHTNWLQLRPGETRECNGCHTNAGNQQNPKSHGRAGLFNAVNTGAPATGQPFPGTTATMSPDQGETMAQTRARQSCSSPPTGVPKCFDMNLSLNVLFHDVWSDPAQRTPDPDITLSYDATVPLAPTSSSCVMTWNAQCRIVINYIQHIQPIWDKDRTVDVNPADGMPDVDAGGKVINHKCSGCHSTVNPADNTAQVPAGQLDLTAVPSDEEQLQLRSYRELFFSDNEQELVGGAVQDVPGPPDANGNPTPGPTVGPYLNAGSARGNLSSAFLNRFATGSGSTHAGWLSPAEVRLLSEWLDIGAQYFNNPFDPAVPVN